MIFFIRCQISAPLQLQFALGTSHNLHKKKLKTKEIQKEVSFHKIQPSFDNDPTSNLYSTVTFPRKTIHSNKTTRDTNRCLQILIPLTFHGLASLVPLLGLPSRWSFATNQVWSIKILGILVDQTPSKTHTLST